MIRAIGGRERFRHSHGPNPVLLKRLLLMGRTLEAVPGQLPAAAPKVRVAAVTGTKPSSSNEPVAAGRFTLPVIALVLRSAVAASVPGPSGIDVWIALM